MTLGDLRWIQYQLDNSATVEEVIQSDAVVRIRSDATPLHFLVADRSGDVATIEFLAGQMVVHRGPDLPVAVLTNSAYDQSLAYLGQFAGFGGAAPIPQSTSSLDRFVRLADRVSRYSGQSAPLDYAFNSLSAVAQGTTQWSIIYEVTGGRAHFRTRTSPSRKSVDLAGLQFLCRYTPRMIDIDSPLAGDVTAAMEPYTLAANRALIYESYRGTDSLKDLPDSVLDSFAALPDSFACCRPRPSRPARRR